MMSESTTKKVFSVCATCSVRCPIEIEVENAELKAMHEAQMAQADKLASIGELSSGVAHEINNPLGVILGYREMEKSQLG